MNNNEYLVDSLINNFFNKMSYKTNHETLANYLNGTLESWGENGDFYTHINYHTMKRSLTEIVKQNKKYYTFVETGCSAHGTKSTLLWDKFVNIFDGNVISVDLDQAAVIKTNNLTSDKTNVTCSDSLKFLPTLTNSIDFLYLDSYDIVVFGNSAEFLFTEKVSSFLNEIDTRSLIIDMWGILENSVGIKGNLYRFGRKVVLNEN